MYRIVGISCISDFERFCAYVGLVSNVRDSGGKERLGRMTKNRVGQWGLKGSATESQVRNCESFVTDYYKQLFAQIDTMKALITTLCNN